MRMHSKRRAAARFDLNICKNEYAEIGQIFVAQMSAWAFELGLSADSALELLGKLMAEKVIENNRTPDANSLIALLTKDECAVCGEKLEAERP